MTGKMLIDDSGDESIIVNPDDVVRRRRVISDVEPNEELEALQKIASEKKISNSGGNVIIRYETMGRFDIPEIMQFSDFTVQDVNDLVLSRQEDLLENVVAILDKRKHTDEECEVQDMLIEELLETLVGIKSEFNTHLHDHPWVCDCQSGIPQDAQIINKTTINLRELKYRSILDIEKDLKSYYTDILKDASEEEFRAWAQQTFKNDTHIDATFITREEAVSNLKIKEPFGVKMANGDIYYFNFLRVRHLINAAQLVEHIYTPKLKEIKNRQTPQNAPIAEFKNQKEKEVEDLKLQKAKDLLTYARAFTLVKVNNKTLTKDESIRLYKDISREASFRMLKFLEQLEFGIHHEIELQCPICGNISKRLLQQEFDPLELLPFDATSKGNNKKPAGLDIYL